MIWVAVSRFCFYCERGQVDLSSERDIVPGAAVRPGERLGLDLADDIRLFDISETARRLQVSAATLADPRWRRRVGIPVVKVGRLIRFNPRALEEWFERRTQGGQ
jgi:Helix-turn-helix domain